MTVRRGEIWYADVPGDKRRPVVVLTRDSVLPRLTTILVAPVTTRVRSIPTEVPVTGLPRACVANLDNIHVVAKQQIGARAGVLAARREVEVKRALGYALGWPELKVLE